MKFNKWITATFLSMISLIFFSFASITNNSNTDNNLAGIVVKADAADQQAINEIMPNQKLQELVLLNMKMQNIVGPDFKLSDFTVGSFKTDLLKLTSLSWPIGTYDENVATQLINGGNGAIGPASVNPGNYSLTGLELATNLTTLTLQGDLNYGPKFFHGDIIDISPLENLTKLTHIDLSGNRISDISPIAKLPNVTTLYINENCISNLNVLDADQYTNGFNYLDQTVIFPVQNLHTNSYTWKAPFVDALPKNAHTRSYEPYQRDALGLTGAAFGNQLDANSVYQGVQVFRNGTYDMNKAKGTQKIVGDDFEYQGLSDQIMPSVDTTDPWGSSAKVVQNPYNYYMIANYVYPGIPDYVVLRYLKPYTITPQTAQPVTVQYVDEQGNSIHAAQTITGNIDQAFDLSGNQFKLNIAGYTFKKYDPAQTGKISDTAQTFKLVYTKNSNPVNPVNPNTPNPPVTPTPTVPVFPTHPTLPDGTQLPNYAQVKNGVVYSLKKIYIYKHADFKKSERVAMYVKKPRINRPMFVVLDYQRSKGGALRYKVRDVNHHSKHAAKVGYITANQKYVRPVYYRAQPKTVTVISAKGVNEYNEKHLDTKIKNFKQGTVLKVDSIVKHNLTTRYMLGNGNFITANRKLVINGRQKQPKRVVVKKAINRYTTVNTTKKNGHYKKGTKISIKAYDYSHKYDNTKSGTKRFQVKGGYITANPKFVKVYY
ncbi:internalin-J precursor [Lentilactobacillus sunkii]|uniref:Internalin-J n=1 Tax=Lentilactobacillus sunkii TaxID=481719 RepID=A0A1E7XEB8_9LACO|nr:DUF5776 domain-containing protein [Lentilactobacillus sunkii]OFA11399.1 internalin-J precursor [Lentilactobacillus sunkii]